MSRILSLLIAAVLLVAPLRAQETLPYTGLDILFLVDQSGSMGGRNYGYAQGGNGADPLGLRFEAVQYALDTLGQYRLTLAPDVEMQIAVINFGDLPDAADIARGWQPVAATGNEADWDAIRGDLLESLSADAFRARNPALNLGNTNFIAVFEAAQQMFNTLPDEDHHLRVIVLLTDGAPCVPLLFECTDLSAQQRHMDQLMAFARTAFPAPDYRIYTLALDASGGLWSQWESDWAQITGSADRAARVETSQQVGIRFLNILVELIAVVRGTAAQPITQLSPGTNTISVPPYLREMRVSIFKSTASPGVLSVTQPGGVELAASDSNLTIQNQDRPIEVWTIRNPQPGDWVFTVGSSEDRIDIYLDLIPVEVTAEITGGTFSQFDDITINLTLKDLNGSPLVTYEEPYRLTVDALLTLPDGSERRISMNQQPDTSYQVIFPAEQPGQYTVSVIASTRTPDGRIYPILDEPDVSAFNVAAIVFKAGDLPQGEYLVGEEVRLDVTLADENNAVLTFPQVEVTAEVTQGSIIERYALEPDGTGQYSLSLLLDDPGDFNLTLQAVATKSDGSKIDLAPPLLSGFSVRPSQLVSLALISPESATITQDTTTGIPAFSPNPLKVSFEARTDGAALVSLDAIAENPETLWTVILRQNGTVVSSENASIREIETGRYEIDFGNLDAGEYQVEIEAGGELSGTYVYDPAASALSLSVTRVISPLYYLSIAAFVLLTAGMVSGIALTLRRQYRLHRHPARGKLVVRQEGADVGLWEVDLDSFRRNYLVFKDKRLRKAGVTRLIVTCPDEKMSQSKRVRVTAKNGRETIFSDRVLSPGSPPLRLQKSSGMFDFAREEGKEYYEIVKDPDSTYF